MPDLEDVIAKAKAKLAEGDVAGAARMVVDALPLPSVGLMPISLPVAVEAARHFIQPEARGQMIELDAVVQSVIAALLEAIERR